MRAIPLTENDLFIYEHEIRPFLPDRLFDSHCHLLANRFHPRLEETMPLASEPLLGEADLSHMRAWWRALFPDSKVTGMLMGFPTADVDVDGENNFVAEMAHSAHFPFALMVKPQTPASQLEAEIRRLKPATLKPYMTFVQGKEPNTASITDLIPESQLALADTHGLAVVLHVAKQRGMADPENLEDISRLIRDYPKCQFILAHCGRCFITPNMDATLDKLPVAENLWLDTSAVCDLGVFVSLLERYDRTRILFGTDLVTAAGFRGSYIRLGMSWHVCTAEMVARSGGMADKTTFAAYENFCALCRAMRFLKLSDAERNAIFHDNAIGLYGLESSTE